MADPLRRNLLAKLRGKKSKKGTPAGGYGAATNGGRAGKGKVSQNPDGQTHPVVMFAELHCLTDNIMRGNDSYVNDIVVNKVGLDQEQSTVGVVETSEFPQQYEASANMHINTSRGPGDNQGSGCSGIRGRVNEELLGVSLQRATQYEGNDRDEMIRIHKQGPGYFSGQLQQGHIGRAHEQRKHFVPIPRQYSAGDSIGFGSNSPNNHMIYHRRPDGVVKMTNGHYPASKSNGTNVCFDKDLKTRVSHGQTDDSCHQTVYNYKADNGQRSINDFKVTANVHPGHNQILKTNVTNNGTQMCPPGIPCAHHPDSNYTEENIVIRNIESYGSSSEFTGDNISVTHLQSPTFFPTELEICDVNVASHFICAREGALRHYSLDSEDDDYYDNVILPFYVSESLGPNDRKSSDKIEAIESGKDVPKGQVISDSVQETDRLRSQLKEAYYLLINTMHDISFDGQVSVNGFIDQASSSSHSRDSMCSRLSIKHVDSDAWSSGEHSVQQVSDTDSILLCLLSENRGDPSLKKNLISKSLVNLSASRTGPPLLRSTSDRAIKYRSGAHNAPCIQALGSQSPACENGDGASRPQAVGASDPFEKQASYNGDTSSDDLLQDTGEDFKLNESSGSVNSLTGSSDNADTQQGGNSKRDGEMSAWDRGGSAKTHGVTVNKMQEWMHKGRLLSSEMKQRIAGSTPQPHGTHGDLDSAPRPSQGQASSVPGGSKPAALTTRVHGAIPATVVPCQSQALHQSAEGPDLATPGFSPPSSPNPAKKGSSLNWSFPDKIKSPRTVRKLSMKMKKLPELSRKLSVKGIPSNNNNTSGNGASASSQSETRTQCPKTNSGSEPGSAPPRLSPGGGQGAAASRNVISRYHLDSSVSTQQSYSKKKSSGTSMSASKGGYLSDGDSPELVAKSGKHRSSEGKGGKGKEKEKDPATGGGERTGAGGVTGGGGSSKLHGTELDIDAFRHYSFTEQPKCTQYISGLMSLHFYGAEDLKPPRVDSRDVYCAIQVDSVNKARTALLTCRTTFLDMDHTFNIELENAQHLKLVVFSWDPTPKKNRVCCHGTVVLPALFRVTRSHQLAVKLEPRGLIYVKLNLMEQWQNSLDGGYDGDRERQMFGVEAWRVVERENSGLMVPLLIEKCITEIEKRGCQVVGLYRLCGSAAVKKELREAFERDSLGVELCENTYPDINVITGVLKDYLRELPYPLITKHLYEAVLDSMAKRPLRIGAGGCENDQADTEQTVSLLENLPVVERLTLRRLLDHLKLVASHHDVNKMTCQNLAVCFGPVLLSQRQEASCHSNRVFIDSEELASALHFKKHIEVLHYLLQLWPVVDPHGKTSSPILEHPGPADQPAAPPLRRRKERPQVLNLSDAEMAGVLRPRPGRLDSPSNRYAGDWSRCGERYLPPPLAQEENDYDDVPSEDMEVTEEGQEGEDRGKEGGEELRQEGLLDSGQEEGQAEPPTAKQEPPLLQEVMEGPVEKEEEEREAEEERVEESDVSSDGQPSDDRVCDDEDERILPLHNPKEHTYQAYMKIQDISPVLSNRVNLRDLQESIDTLIGNLERELNKNNLKVSY
uniref:Synapse defective Rho GTPase homolog 2 n=1 Tax=Oncorhynchus kisutch TaxID=8019 RepID=A0A8C7FXQ1_ONCKI